MAQILIVEGKDAYVLVELCKKRGINAPKGYETEDLFKGFIVEAKGYHKALVILKTELKRPNLSNIGIIVDADNKGYHARWQEIRKILVGKYEESTLTIADAQSGPKTISEPNMPTLGVWIMPDNASEGYLEHFLAKLVPANSPLWDHASKTVDELQHQDFNELSGIRTDKAKMHTWLAWKKEPGKPFGTAMTSNYFDPQAPAAKDFTDWFAQTFELES